jgi:predicted nucleic acid-binding protein
LAKLRYVKAAFPSLLIPTSVRVETIEKGKFGGYPDALVLEKLEDEGWLRTLELASASEKMAQEIAEVVGKGEAESIALALEKKDRLLMDDQKGRQMAELYGVETTTTLGLLFELLVQGVLPMGDYARNVKNYASQGWVTPDVVQEFLEKGGRLE